MATKPIDPALTCWNPPCVSVQCWDYQDCWFWRKEAESEEQEKEWERILNGAD